MLACSPEEPPPPDAGDAGVDAGGSGSLPCPRDAGAFDAGIADGPTNECAGGLVLSGLGLRWADGAHRLARWGVFPRIGAEHFPESCPPGSALRGAALVSLLEGGPETRGPDHEGGDVRATYHVVGLPEGGAPDAGSFAGLRMARGEQTVDLVAEAEGSAPVLFDLGLARMAGAPSVVVLLDGLDLATDVPQVPAYPSDYDPRDGYSTRGIGAWIANVRRDGDDLRFDVGARFALGTRDRPAMNRAVGVARTRAVVHFAVVALAEPPTMGMIRYRERHRGHGAEELSVCRPDPSVSSLILNGAPGLAAAPGLSAFSLRLFSDTDIEGDDMRELSIRIMLFDYDTASGRASMQVEGYASNEGPPPPALPMDTEVEAEVVLLQWAGAPAEELVLDARVGVGRTETALPMLR